MTPFRFVLLLIGIQSTACLPQGWSDATFASASTNELRTERLVHPDGNSVNLVWGELEGHGAWYFLDTGAQVAVLDAEARRAIEAKTLRTVPLNRSVQAEMIRTGPFRLGRLTVDDPIFFAFDLEAFLRRAGAPDGLALPNGERAAGVLGFPVLRHGCLRVLYGDKDLASFGPSDSTCHDSGRNWVPARVENGVPWVEGSVEGHRGWFQLDTGKSYGASLSSHFVGSAGLDDGREFEVVDNHRIEGVSKEHRVQIEELELGGTRLGGLTVHYRLAGTAAARQEGEAAGVVGREVLKRFVVIFDYPNSRVALDPLP